MLVKPAPDSYQESINHQSSTIVNTSMWKIRYGFPHFYP